MQPRPSGERKRKRDDAFLGSGREAGALARALEERRLELAPRAEQAGPHRRRPDAELGGQHVNCNVKDCVVDKANKIATTPAYMLAQSVAEAAVGIEKTVRALIEMA